MQNISPSCQRLEVQANEIQERLEEREEIDAFLTALLRGQELCKVLVDRINQEGLGRKLLSL